MAQRSLLRSTAWRWYVAAGSALTAVYFLLPAGPAKLVVWPAIGWSSVAAICVGLRLHKPDAPAAWYLLAAGGRFRPATPGILVSRREHRAVAGGRQLLWLSQPGGNVARAQPCRHRLDRVLHRLGCRRAPPVDA